MAKVEDAPFARVGAPGILGAGGETTREVRRGALGAWLGRIAYFWGIDQAVAYTLFGRGWAVVAGPITMLLMVRFYSLPQQGFYYTFASILGLQVLFELGLAFVLIQLASHESAILRWTEQGMLEGESMARARLSSLVRVALRWYAMLAVLIVACILPAGLVFFGVGKANGAEIAWRLPWIWVVMVTGVNVALTPFFAVIEGCGQVAEVALMRFGQGVVGNLILWAGFSQHLGLYALAMMHTTTALWSLSWLAVRHRRFFADLVGARLPDVRIDWRREVWPLQWKIALSWFSSFFIFQLFNPILFAYHGAAAAGQMGMSSSMMAAISSVALAWVTTKSAPYGALIARGEFEELDRLFFSSLWQSLVVIAACGTILWSAAAYLHYVGHSLSHRILPLFPLALLIGAGVLNHVVIAEAIYLRAHKEEPFLWVSVIIAALTSSSAYLLGRPWGALGMMVGYFSAILVVGTGVGSWIFVRKRRAWHQPGRSCAAAAGPA
jgi:hypothetical protein